MRYRANRDTIYTDPEMHVKSDGTASMSISLPICVVHKIVENSEEAAKLIAKLMNLGEAQIEKEGES